MDHLLTHKSLLLAVFLPLLVAPASCLQLTINPARIFGGIKSGIERVGAKVMYGGGCPADGKKIFTSADYDSASDSGGSFDHTLWDEILKECVSRETIRGVETNTFDYSKLVPIGVDGAVGERFDSYLAQLSSADLDSLSPNHQLALLMNAYNALCVNILVRKTREAGESENPLQSILDLNSQQDGKVWEQPAGELCGRTVTLSVIEHEMLRAVWSDARLHACINCASVSCPDIRSEAYRGDASLDGQMTDQMKRWVSNKQKGLRIEGDTVYLSSIFNWFDGDFKPTVLDFVQPYLDETDTKALDRIKKPKKVFVDYDWGING